MSTKTKWDLDLFADALVFVGNEFGRTVEILGPQAQSAMINAIYRMILLSQMQGPHLFDSDLAKDIVATARFTADSNHIVGWTHQLLKNLHAVQEKHSLLDRNGQIVAEALIESLEQDYVDFFRFGIGEPNKKSDEEKAKERSLSVDYDLNIDPDKLSELLEVALKKTDSRLEEDVAPRYVEGEPSPELLSALVKRNPSIFRRVERADMAIRNEIQPKGNPYPFIGFGRTDFLDEEIYIYDVFEEGDLTEDGAVEAISELIRAYYKSFK